MSTITDLIKQRRSIRKYSPRKVERDILQEILEAAQWAPSAHNAQPWRFLILINETLKRNLAEAMANNWKADLTKDEVSVEVRRSIIAASVERFTYAPVLIVACLAMKDMVRYEDEVRQKCERDLAVQSLGAAIQNMLLTTHANNLGACWFCAPIFCKETVRKVLKIPDGVEPQALITLGYPAEKPRCPPRKRSEQYSYLSYWGKNFDGNSGIS